MGHSISAAIVSGEVDAETARRFDMHIIALPLGFSMLPLEASYCDHWADKLQVLGFVSEDPILNCKVVHYIIEQAYPGKRFALIETDYFGGVGNQCAAVYEAGRELMAPKSAELGPINEALRLLGVRASAGRDEFDTLELGRWRNFGGLFEKYWPTG